MPLLRMDRKLWPNGRGRVEGHRVLLLVKGRLFRVVRRSQAFEGSRCAFIAQYVLDPTPPQTC